jgi:hypothetical protein
MAKNEVNAQELLKQAVPTGHWRYILDNEHPAAIEALKAVLGREAKLPSWQRRLAVTADGATFLIVIDDCRWRHPSSIAGWNELDVLNTTGLPTALPIEAAVQLLNSDQSPEKELQRRRALAAERDLKVAERARIEAEKARAEVAEVNRERQARLDNRADIWEKLNPLQQFGARLALAVEKRDPKLAADIRTSVDASPSDFPLGQWWTGLDRTMEAIRVAAVYEIIPIETRTLLKLQHGPYPAKIVAAWEAMRAPVKNKAA